MSKGLTLSGGAHAREITLPNWEQSAGSRGQVWAP